mmetsp:Transcript_118377/g.377331  ORF Transcript_118377/g.377331 Transcript_118377/m.377331 type:complete len:240 (-) Transcript_118377:595-1314(-)
MVHCNIQLVVPTTRSAGQFQAPSRLQRDGLGRDGFANALPDVDLGLLRASVHAGGGAVVEEAALQEAVVDGRELQRIQVQRLLGILELQAVVIRRVRQPHALVRCIRQRGLGHNADGRAGARRGGGPDIRRRRGPLCCRRGRGRRNRGRRHDLHGRSPGSAGLRARRPCAGRLGAGCPGRGGRGLCAGVHGAVGVVQCGRPIAIAFQICVTLAMKASNEPRTLEGKEYGVRIGMREHIS